MSEALNSIVPRYGKVSFGTRLFLEARWRLTPYAEMASYLPRAGKILDLGCGHGLLALTLALESSERQVLAIDHDSERVELARRASRGVPNIEFEKGSVLAPPPGPYSGIALIDVMHYFPPKIQEQMLMGIRASLAPGGVALIREVEPQGGFASGFNRFYEKVATATGFTRSNREGLHFRNQEQWTQLLQSCGFEVQAQRCGSRLFADILYICRT